MEKVYNFLAAEKKWQKIWQESRLSTAKMKVNRQPFSIVLLPPAATTALHMGHALTLTTADIIIRRKKMQGFNVLWDTGFYNPAINDQPDAADMLGIALDPDRIEFTLNREMHESINKTFVQLFKEGKIYREKHWFLKTAGSVKPAAAAVDKGEIKFIPEKWEKIYLNWLTNLRDWPISHKSSRGNRIPAHYCRDCGNLMVEETIPKKCSKCDSPEIEQDQEVFAPWFFPALRPLIISDRAKKEKEFTAFYPANLAAAGFEITYTSVFKMIIVGIHCGSTIPFREILINGPVKDENGQRLDELNKNTLNPLALIDEYGADTLRFTLAIQAVPGVALRLSANRIRGYNSFIKKIWHAARFILMNSAGDIKFNIVPDQLTTPDKWILHFLNKTGEKVNELMDSYRINRAADLLYRFFRNEYCGWYLEFSKKNIASPGTRKVLKFTLMQLLQLLHPFLPFITEEIFRKIKTGKDFLLQTEYPSFNSKFIFYDEFSNIELLKNIIRETRKIRVENRVDPKQKINIYLKTGSEKEKNILAQEIKYYNFLTGSAKTGIVPGFENLPKGFKGFCANWEILLPFNSDMDRVKELTRLKKEFAELENHIVNLEKKLADREFINSANQSNIMKVKKSLQLAINKKEKMKSTINDLS